MKLSTRGKTLANDLVLFSESTIFSQVCVVVYSPPRIMSENAEFLQ